MENWTPCALLVLGLYNGAVIVEQQMEAPQKLNIELSYNPEIPLPGIYKQLKAGTQISVH